MAPLCRRRPSGRRSGPKQLVSFNPASFASPRRLDAFCPVLTYEYCDDEIYVADGVFGVDAAVAIAYCGAN
jgi:hypothetical protein